MTCIQFLWKISAILSFVLMLVVSAAAQEDIRQREEWFYGVRAYPLAHIPAGARLKALQQMDGMLKAQEQAAIQEGGSPSLATTLSTTSWTLVGPQPTQVPTSKCGTTWNSIGCQWFGLAVNSGRVTVLAVDASDSTGQTIYLGTAEGGVWNTTNGGNTWTPLPANQYSLAVGSIALDPTTSPTTIYIGTGEENFGGDNYYGAGVLKFDGTKWFQDVTFSTPLTIGTLTEGGPFIGALSVDPSNNQTLLAAVRTPGYWPPSGPLSSGVWQSNDGGHSWKHVLPPDKNSVCNVSAEVATDVVFDPRSPGWAYAALGNLGGDFTCNGVYLSVDHGATWSQIFHAGSGSVMGVIKLALGPPPSGQQLSELLVAIANATSCNPTTGKGCSTDLYGLYLLTWPAGVETWATLNAPNFCENQCSYDMAIRVSPTNPNLIYAGGVNSFGGQALIVSTTGGSTWSADLYAGGSITSPNYNASGQLHSDTHAIAFAGTAASPILLVGNDGGVWRTTNVGVTSNVTWTELNDSLSLTQFYQGLSIYPGNPNLAFGGTQDNTTQAYTGSLTWQFAGACGDGGPTAINAATSQLYYACAVSQGLGVAQFTSSPFSISAPSWGGNGIGTCTSSPPSSNCYTALFAPPLAQDPENAQTLYFGTDALYQTKNGTTSWTKM